MMNKMKSAGMHIVKFLFILPMVAVLLVAFRKGKNDQQQPEKPFVKPGNETVRIDTVPFVTTPNSKGYLIDVIGVNGECTVVIKDKKGKEIERVVLDKWKENKKYEEQYGEILPPPPPPPIPPVEPVAPVEPVTPLPPIEPVAPLLPLDCPITNMTTPKASVNGGINLRGISREYEITNTKAELKLLDGTIEKYDLTNKKEKAEFEKKYGKIINLNTNANLNGNVVSTIAPAGMSSNGITAVSSTTPRPTVAGTTVIAPMAASEGVMIIDDYGPGITGNEDISIIITKNTTHQQLDDYIRQMKARGIELSYDEIEYNTKGQLVAISGHMISKDGRSNFVANDFDKLILAMIKKGDKTWFKVSVKDKEVI